MKVREIMTPTPATTTPESTARDAARLMKQHDCGSLPVCGGSSGELVGVVTDRDIVVRGVAEDRPTSTPVRELMTPSPQTVRVDDDLDAVERVMADHQVRRVPVVDESGKVAGIVSQADLARELKAVGKKDFGKVMESISEPAGVGR
jgi:CBS domain-containing protein